MIGYRVDRAPRLEDQWRLVFRLLHQSSIAPNPADVGAMTAGFDAIKK